MIGKWGQIFRFVFVCHTNFLLNKKQVLMSILAGWQTPGNALGQASFDRLPSTGFLRQAQGERGGGFVRGGVFRPGRGVPSGAGVFVRSWCVCSARGELVEPQKSPETILKPEEQRDPSTGFLRQASFDRLRMNGSFYWVSVWKQLLPGPVFVRFLKLNGAVVPHP